MDEALIDSIVEQTVMLLEEEFRGRLLTLEAENDRLRGLIRERASAAAEQQHLVEAT